MGGIAGLQPNSNPSSSIEREVCGVCQPPYMNPDSLTPSCPRNIVTSPQSPVRQALRPSRAAHPALRKKRYPGL